MARLETLQRWADEVSTGAPVTVPREVANLAENILIRLEQNPDLLDRILGHCGYLPRVAGARYAISRAIEGVDAGETLTAWRLWDRLHDFARGISGIYAWLAEHEIRVAPDGAWMTFAGMGVSLHPEESWLILYLDLSAEVRVPMDDRVEIRPRRG